MMLEHALAYAARGWPVFPLHSAVNGRCTCSKGDSCPQGDRGKHPRTPHGFHDATTDAAKIREWWGRHPDANIGIATGAKAQLLVVDSDAKNGGPQTLAELEVEHGALPETLVQDTGGGGKHHLFRHPDDCKIGNKTGVQPGIDVRGEGGYIVAPPSMHGSGRRYAWRTDPTTTEIAEAPDWVLKLCRGELGADKQAAKQAPPVVATDPDRVRGALRHIPSDDRDTWLRVGAALKHDLGEQGRAIWDEWSSTCTKFDPRDQHKTWESLTDHPNPATLATIFHLAQGQGWNPVPMRGASRNSTPGGVSGPTNTFDLTDAGNAARFVFEQHSTIRFNVGIGWLAWNGSMWVHAQAGEAIVFSHAKRLALRFHEEAALAANTAAYAPRLARAKRAASRQGLEAVLSLASKDSRLLVEASDLDSNPRLLNCPNGIVDLRTGTLLPHDPKHLMTHIAGVAYDPEAECTQWSQTLKEVFAGNDQDDVINFLQLAAGYTLTGLTREEIFFMLWGDGRNGKGTVVDQIRKAMGSYAQTATMGLFLAQKNDNSKQFEIAGLMGARMVVASEAGPDRSFDTELVKSFTGGDKRKASFKHKAHFEYMGTDKLWLQVNDKPKVPSWDRAFQERCRLLPFLNQFTEEKGNIDRNRKSDLERELAGILAWAVRGSVRYLAEGLRAPERVRAAVEEYRTENTRVDEFLEQHFFPVANSDLLQSRVYAAYRNWCQSQGVRPVAENRFGEHLHKAGYDTHKGNAGKIVLGIGVLDGVQLPAERGQAGGGRW